MHISVTRLKLRSPFLLFAFIGAANECVEQAEAARGFHGGALLVDQWFTFWTVTGWDNIEAMRGYRDSGAHREIMPKILDWCSEASVAAFEAPAIPGWPEIHRAVVEQGRATKLKHPSRKHQARIIGPLHPWAPPRELKPALKPQT